MAAALSVGQPHNLLRHRLQELVVLVKLRLLLNEDLVRGHRRRGRRRDDTGGAAENRLRPDRLVHDAPTRANHRRVLVGEAKRVPPPMWLPPMTWPPPTTTRRGPPTRVSPLRMRCWCETVVDFFGLAAIITSSICPAEMVGVGAVVVPGRE